MIKDIIIDIDLRPMDEQEQRPDSPVVGTPMAGGAGRPHRIRATIGEVRINGDLHTSGGKYSLQTPPSINKPGTGDLLKTIARTGTQLIVEHERYSELGARISWLRSDFFASDLIAVSD
jgi:hypothetical protein